MDFWSYKYPDPRWISWIRSCAKRGQNNIGFLIVQYDNGCELVML
uniref:Uncharacterized protein n=1 Tax=Arundo donax TaxID=35708 RepID=A0A0A8ZX83_ARUDO